MTAPSPPSSAVATRDVLPFPPSRFGPVPPLLVVVLVGELLAGVVLRVAWDSRVDADDVRSRLSASVLVPAPR